MVDPQHEHLRRLFDEAIELPAALRAAFVDLHCAADPRLHKRLQVMLAAVDDDRFLRALTLDIHAAPASASAGDRGAISRPPSALGEGPGSRIGPYLLLEQIGEGGFGVVFLAEQQEPIARRVALKIVKLGMDTRQVVARFEQERQALAVMDHPNIARVLDAGATVTGRPFFVMDLVRGIPITDYCDRNSSTIGDRLALFAQVCDAVQHAHQKGIIHRDLKPSNVLVSTQDGKALAKVIDFGIAKATTQKLTDNTLLTEHRQVIGTLQYMSPEQAEGSIDIDTRSDIYSLGVLLYELLAGSTPFEVGAVNDALFGEIQRMICEVEPPKPSTRISAARDKVATIAASRGSDARGLGLSLRGDLDWIVMRALSKDRSRRYESAHDFAEDIQRHLRGEAVVAAPPSAVYQLRKFLRRNRKLMLASTAVAVSLIAGIVAFAWQATIASERAAQLEVVVGFQDRMLGSLDATTAGVRLMSDIRQRHATALSRLAVRPDDPVARTESFEQELARVNPTDTAVAILETTLLAPSVEAMASEFVEQPLVAARLRQTMAALYLRLGRHEPAVQLHRLALDTRQQLLGEHHELVLSSCNDLADALDKLGDFAAAEPLHRRAADGRRDLLGAEHPDTLRSLGNLGGNLRYQSRFAEAEPLLRQVLESTRRVLGDEHRDTLIRLNTLGYVLIDQARPAEAEPYWREAHEIGKRLFGADDPDVIVWTNNLGGLLGELGRQAEGETYYREALAAAQRVHGLEHPATADLVQNLATCLLVQNRPAEAEAFARDALTVRRRLFGDDHTLTLRTMSGLGAALSAQGRFAEAEPWLRDAWSGLVRTLGKPHPETLRGGRDLAVFLSERGDPVAAEALYRELLDSATAALGDGSADRMLLQHNLGHLLLRQERFEEAEVLLRSTFELSRQVMGDEHQETLVSQITLASVAAKLGRLDEAEASYRDATVKFRRVLGSEHSTTLSSLSNHGQVLLKLSRFGEAEPLLREAAAGFDQMLGNGHNRATVARSCLGDALLGLGRFAEAEAELLAADRAVSANPDAGAKRRLASAESLLKLYRAWHAADGAGGHDRSAATWQAKLEELQAAAGK